MIHRTPVVLIVEDDLDTRDVLGRFLSGAGYAVRLASNGWDALVACETHVDLILLDMMMPGMDGPTFLRSLRGQRHCAEVPVVVLTAMDRSQVEPLVAAYNVSGILTKGGDAHHELKAVLRRTLETPRPTSRVTLPARGSMMRPYLDPYLKMLAWA